MRPVRHPAVLGLVDLEVELPGEVALLGLGAGASGDVRPALALAAHDVAVVVVRAAGIAVARLAAVAGLGQSPVLGQALVAVAPGHVALARALAAVHVAALVLVRAEQVARARLAAVRVLLGEVPEAVPALVAPAALHVRLAVALPRLDPARRVRAGVADPVVERTARVAIARNANLWVLDGFRGVLR